MQGGYSDKDLLERFEADVSARVPHVESGKVVNPTPLVDVTAALRECARDEYGLHLSEPFKVYAKFDSKIIGGSVKVRPAVRIVGEALASGRLRRGRTVFEPTSGNVGLALGMLG